MKRFALFCGVLSLVLSGCLVGGTGSSDVHKGNADGYGGGKERVVKTAFLMKPGNTCAGSAEVLDYSEALQFLEDGATQRVDACTKAVTAVPSDKVKVLDDVVAGAQGNLYEFRPEPPVLQSEDWYYNAWCAEVGTSLSVGLLVKRTNVSDNFAIVPYSTQDEKVVLADSIDVSVAINAITRVFEGEGAKLTVRSTLTDIIHGYYPGSFEYQGRTRSVLCILLQPKPAQ